MVDVWSVIRMVLVVVVGRVGLVLVGEVGMVRREGGSYFRVSVFHHSLVDVILELCHFVFILDADILLLTVFLLLSIVVLSAARVHLLPTNEHSPEPVFLY